MDSEQSMDSRQGDARRSTKAQQSMGMKLESQGTVLSAIHQVNQHEIQAGQIATERAQDSRVQDFARRMVNDHRQADQRVMDLAQSANIDLQMPDQGQDAQAKMDKKEQAKLNQLKQAQGAAFDREYMMQMVQGHQHAVSLVQAAQQKFSGQRIEPLLNDLLPQLRSHLNDAQQLQRQLRVSARRGSPGR